MKESSAEQFNNLKEKEQTPEEIMDLLGQAFESGAKVDLIIISSKDGQLIYPKSLTIEDITEDGNVSMSDGNSVAEPDLTLIKRVTLD